ncbi:MAG: 50S ribosomal protein L23, partial [Flavobacteriales bacterium]
ANKLTIKNAVEEMYGVTVESVNTMIVAGTKRQRFTKGGIIKGKTSTVKKAIVTLVEGDSIDFYSHV